jgi:hypothetical protein
MTLRIRERAAGILPEEEAWMPTFVPPWLNSSERIV